MIQRFVPFLAPPQLEDESQNQIAGLLQTLLFIFLLGIVLIAIATIAFSPDTAEGRTSLVSTLFIDALAGLGFVWFIYLVRRGYVRFVSYTFILLLVGIATAVLYLFNGLRDPVVGAYFIAIILTGVLLREGRRVVEITGLIVGLALFLYFSESTGLTAPVQDELGFDDWATYAITFLVVGLLVRSAILSLVNALVRAQTNERALASVNSELAGLNETLEVRVSERTRALELSAEISRRLSTILDQDQLVSEVVNSVQQAFDYYYVQIYLVGEEEGVLRMVGGTGSPGRVMLSRHHQVKMGEGLVGQAASTNYPVHAPDVAQVTNWLDNPLLPETRSEAAIPIAYGEDILGVLDVQDRRVHGLEEQDVQLLQTLAFQIAIALQNAKLYAEAQGQAQQEALINQITQRIQETTTVEGALQIAVREIGRAINAQQAHIRLDNSLLKEASHAKS